MVTELLELDYELDRLETSLDDADAEIARLSITPGADADELARLQTLSRHLRERILALDAGVVRGWDAAKG